MVHLLRNPMTAVIRSWMIAWLSLSSIACRSSTSAIETLDQLVFKELTKNRVVMLGDGSHGGGSYLRLLTNVLKYWLCQLRSHPGDTCNPKKLVLVVETVDQEVEALYKYLKGGDSAPWLEFVYEASCRWGGWGGLTTDEIEFWDDFRNIWIEVAHSRTVCGLEDLELTLMAGEAIDLRTLDDHPGETQETSEKRRFEWFALRRDSLIAQKVAAFLSLNSGHKALVFYGTAHLLRGIENKNRISGLDAISGESMKAYFLAHYLDSLIGRESVSVITSSSNNDNICNIEHFTFDKRGPDHKINQSVVPPETFPVDLTRSRRTLTILLRQLVRCGYEPDRASQDLARATSRRFLCQIGRSYLAFDVKTAPIIDSLRRTALSMNTPQAIKRFVSSAEVLTTQFNAQENIKEIDKWIEIWGCPDSTLYVDELRRVLRNVTPARHEALSLRDRIRVGHSSARLRDEEHTILLGKRNELQLYLTINLLWIGTPDERKVAVASLQESTGLSFNSAKEWSEWWRNRFTAVFSEGI